MIKKRDYLFILLSILFVILMANQSFAQVASGTPEIYKVRITKFELSSDNGTTWVTVFSGTSDWIDIASVTAGQKAGEFFSRLQVAPGTYNKVRVTVSATFRMKGSVAYSGNTYYTSASGATTTAANYAEQDITIPSGNPTSEETMTITVGTGSTPKIVRVSFTVENKLDLYMTPGATFYPAAPTVAYTVY